MTQKKEKSFLNDFFTLGVGTFLYLVVGVIGTPIITRLVDPVDYGRMSMITVYSGIGVLVCGLGLDQTLVRFFYHNENINFKRKLLQFCCALPLLFVAVLSVLLVLFRFAAAAFGFNLLTVTELVLLILNTIAQLLHRYGMLILRLRYSTKMHSVVNIIQKASYIIMSVVFVCSTNLNHFLILAVSTIFSGFFAFFGRKAITVSTNITQAIPNVISLSNSDSMSAKNAKVIFAHSVPRTSPCHLICASLW